MRDDCPIWAPPLLAVQFLTRIPAPWLDRLTPAQVQAGLTSAVGWFPLVGALVGMATAAVILLAEGLWPRTVAVVIALAIEARLTGAFHEDAVADFCDAFGGGVTADQVRTIMKDSRVGTYGALGLGLAVGLRAVLLIGLPGELIFITLLASACFGRLLVVIAMLVIPPAPSGTGLAKDIGGAVGWRHLALAMLLAAPAMVPLALERPWALAGAGAAAAVFLWWFRALLLRRIGGSTGDCLGFAAYAGQLFVLLAVAAR